MPRTTAAIEIGNSVISLLWQLWFHCNLYFRPRRLIFPFTPNSGACCQASKLSFVGFSVLICQSISKTPCRIIVFDCRRCRHNIHRQSFCHRLCFDRELDFVIYECSIPRFKRCKRYERSEVFWKGYWRPLWDRSFFHRGDREVGDSPHHLCMLNWLVYWHLQSFITCRNKKGNLGLEYSKNNPSVSWIITTTSFLSQVR